MPIATTDLSTGTVEARFDPHPAEVRTRAAGLRLSADLTTVRAA